jgi:hypothetical protein
LQGFRCYSDASISPDQLALGEWHTGPISFFIKASMQRASSVLVAEFAALTYPNCQQFYGRFIIIDPHD